MSEFVKFSFLFLHGDKNHHQLNHFFRLRTTHVLHLHIFWVSAGQNLYFQYSVSGGSEIYKQFTFE